jgi:hypothetical protein
LIRNKRGHWYLCLPLQLTKIDIGEKPATGEIGSSENRTNITALDPDMLLSWMQCDTTPIAFTSNHCPSMPVGVCTADIASGRSLASQDRTPFSLTNVHWQVLCGRRTAKDRMQHLMKKMDLQPAIDLLAQSSSRVATSVAYMEHLHARLATLDIMQHLGACARKRHSQGTQSMEV